MDTRDLMELDRTTLRLWRATNLIGWGAAGLGAFAVAWVLCTAVAQALADASPEIVRYLALPVGIATLLVPPLVAGIVIGDHVYRWPGWTTISASVIPASAFAWYSLPDHGWQEMAITMMFPVVIGLITARVSRERFKMRPRALRSP